MVLVDYDSSDSEQDPPSTAVPPKEKARKSSKPAFEKLVDKAKPGLIRVNLAEEVTQAGREGVSDGPEPPAKRAKTSTFGGFNSFLPAPKRAGGPTGGLAKGLNLKTGAAPGFTREVVAKAPDYDHDQEGGTRLDMDESKVTQTAPLDGKNAAISDGATDSLKGEPPKKPSTMFKPLSVARKPAKKKLTPAENTSTASQFTTAKAASTDQAPKVSLFSIEDVSEKIRPSTNPASTYQPLVYTTQQPPYEPNPNTHDTWDESQPQEATEPQPTSSHHEPQSLDSIATDLNLSASARRQLLGRNHHHHQQQSNTLNKNATSSSPIKITTFNTDEEYAANEILRQSGEIVQHNAVRGVAPGKHSLKQLVNAATTQKDALEEQFAAGRRNKSEAGARYGW